MAFATSNIAGANFTQIDTILNTTTDGYGQFVETGSGFALGTVALSSSGSAYVYVQFGSGGATGAGYVCNISPAFAAVMVTTANDAFGAPIGVAQAAASATNFGWLQIYGPGNVWVLANAAANVPLSTCATTGGLDDGSAVGTLVVDGLVLTTLRGGTDGLAPAWINWPKYITNPNITP